MAVAKHREVLLSVGLPTRSTKKLYVQPSPPNGLVVPGSDDCAIIYDNRQPGTATRRARAAAFSSDRPRRSLGDSWRV